MSKRKILKRSRVKPFLKYANMQHLMPTRYVVDIDVKKTAGQVCVCVFGGRGVVCVYARLCGCVCVCECVCNVCVCRLT